MGSDGRSHSTDVDVKDLPPHRDEDQVQLDVNRSFVYYPEGEKAYRFLASLLMELSIAR